MIKTLVNRFKKSKKNRKEDIKNTQELFKRFETGGKRFFEPGAESRASKKSYKEIMERVKRVRKQKEERDK